MKYLIINAEDFGFSKVFNEKILELAERELISSVSVMVNHINENQEDQVKKLIEISKKHNVSVGLHLEFLDEEFQPAIERQYEKFNSIFQFKPTHIDLHKSKFLKESYSLIMEFCKKEKIPCRNHKIESGVGGVIQTDNPVFSGTRKVFRELKLILGDLKEGESYEVLFHPGKYDPKCESNLNREREFDIKKIEDLNLLLKGNDIKLISFNDLNM
ncbi:MAG: ChbG/HpnK family deacetylase [Patescibacteria group bacterium]|nr:ChbG/HpnK family deacetylase [Patescibacteria group bacterium]